jgi:hypothetical protein
LLFAILIQYVFAILQDMGSQGDTLPFARQYVNSEWIVGDWYLNLKVGYRNLFNLIFGNLYDQLGFRTTILIGEAIIASTFVFLIYQFFKSLKIDFIFLPLFVILYNLVPSLFANEWIVGDVDTKVFAYLFGLSAILCLSQNYLKRGLILLGLASSFHVLIGIYLSVASTIAYLFRNKIMRNWSPLRPLIKNFYLYLIFAFNALLFAYEWLANASITTEKATFINELLVRTRLNHHLWPTDLSWGSFLITLLIFSFLLFQKTKMIRSDLRNYYIALFSVFYIYLILGCILGALDQYSLMKFYLFRIPDTLILFFSFMAGAYLLSQRTQIKLPEPAIIFFTVLIFSVAIVYHLPIKDTSFASRKNQTLFNWIKKNTSRGSVFLIPPKWKNFYLDTERSQFISYKHLPQNNKDIWEWVTRLRELGCDLTKGKGSRALKNELKFCYRKIDSKKIISIHKKYGVNYFISKRNFDSSFKRLFTSDGFSVYELSEKGKSVQNL